MLCQKERFSKGLSKVKFKRRVEVQNYYNLLQKAKSTVLD